MTTTLDEVLTQFGYTREDLYTVDIVRVISEMKVVQEEAAINNGEMADTLNDWITTIENYVLTDEERSDTIDALNEAIEVYLTGGSLILVDSLRKIIRKLDPDA